MKMRASQTIGTFHDAEMAIWGDRANDRHVDPTNLSEYSKAMTPSGNFGFYYEYCDEQILVCAVTPDGTILNGNEGMDAIVSTPQEAVMQLIKLGYTNFVNVLADYHQERTERGLFGFYPNEPEKDVRGKPRPEWYSLAVDSNGVVTNPSLH
jgi:hypothetical protein